MSHKITHKMLPFKYVLAFELNSFCTCTVSTDIGCRFIHLCIFRRPSHSTCTTDSSSINKGSWLLTQTSANMKPSLENPKKILQPQRVTLVSIPCKLPVMHKRIPYPATAACSHIWWSTLYISLHAFLFHSIAYQGLPGITLIVIMRENWCVPGPY